MILQLLLIAWNVLFVTMSGQPFCERSTNASKRRRNGSCEAIFSDRNGETSGLNLGDQAAKKLRQRRGFHSDSKLGKLYRCLAYRSYAVTKATLCRESGMTPLSVYKGIQTLRRKGYQIETLSGFGIKRRYKLAS
jgi:biotin operon repressor